MEQLSGLQLQFWGIHTIAAFRKIRGFMLLSAKGGTLNNLFENLITKMQQASYVRCEEILTS